MTASMVRVTNLTPPGSECNPYTQGGNTGLVGGGVPLYDEVVLGLKRMVWGCGVCY
jgi:hypothetical protein